MWTNEPTRSFSVIVHYKNIRLIMCEKKNTIIIRHDAYARKTTGPFFWPQPFKLNYCFCRMLWRRSFFLLLWSNCDNSFTICLTWLKSEVDKVCQTLTSWKWNFCHSVCFDIFSHTAGFNNSFVFSLSVLEAKPSTSKWENVMFTRRLAFSLFSDPYSKSIAHITPNKKKKPNETSCATNI